MESWVDRPVLVHVGLHKTATTWLQEVYFPASGSGFWIPSSGSKAAKDVGYWLFRSADGHLLNDDEFDAADVRRRLLAMTPPAAAVPVISNERLAGHPFSGGFDRAAIARRIRDVFPQASILVTIRAQEALLLSNYLQYLKYGGWHTPESFLRPPENSRTPSLNLGFWDYERLSALYAQVFGRKRVLFLPQEALRREPLSFAMSLASFAGVEPPTRLDSSREVNPRRQAVSTYYLRRLTWLRNKSAANAFAPPVLSKGIDRQFEIGVRKAVDLATPQWLDRRVLGSLDQRVRKAIGDQYLASNQRFAAEHGLDLAALGYRM